MKTLSYVNFIISILFMACYAYQAVYLVAALLKKQKVFKAKKLHRYGVLIAARNEEAVIAQLIRSVRAQKYPEELIDIFVVADNCTDNTAQAAREAGAVVYERHNTYAVGKGYALRFLLENIFKNFGEYAYDGFFVFDADNILDENFISEMNHVFDNGYKVVTSYRNSEPSCSTRSSRLQAARISPLQRNTNSTTTSASSTRHRSPDIQVSKFQLHLMPACVCS